MVDPESRDAPIGTRYAATYAASIEDPSQFWMQAAQDLDWHTPPTLARKSEDAMSSWFPDGQLNISYQALDRHVVDGRGDRDALIYDSAMTGDRISYTYAQLLDEVARTAGALRELGVKPGDRVLVYMPMIPETLVALLACARIGAVHVVTFGGFAAKEISTRIDDVEPKVVLTASGGIEPSRIVDYLPTLAHALDNASAKPQAVLVKNRPQVPGSAADYEDHWFDWDSVVGEATPAEAVPMESTAPLYLLHTSGTTAKPKAVVRDTGGYAVAMAWSMVNIYDVGPGDVFFAPSDFGWVVGHSYITYGPLIAGSATVVYEGKPVGTPDAGAFWRIINDYKVKAMFAAPTTFRAIRKVDPEAEELTNYDTSTLKSIFVAGERLDEATYQWATEKLGVPVIDHWWQTETGWAISANLQGLEPMPIKPGSASVTVPGYRLKILNNRGDEVPTGTEGNIVLELPLPPGTLIGLWNDPERLDSSYLATFPGFYLSGDAGYVDEDGYLFVLGRSDDVINVAGHRMSTGSIEAVIASHESVAESAVIGVNDPLKGQRPVAYVVLKSTADIDPEKLRAELISSVRRQVGAVAAFRDVEVVQALPKTRSGKILRATMRSIVDGQDYKTPATIEDPSVLQDFSDTVSRASSTDN